MIVARRLEGRHGFLGPACLFQPAAFDKTQAQIIGPAPARQRYAAIDRPIVVARRSRQRLQCGNLIAQERCGHTISFFVCPV